MQPHNITNHIKLNMTSAALFGLLTFFSASGIYAQSPPPPPPPPPGYGHGSNQNQRPGQGGDAPLGSGLALLIGLTAVYGAWKFKRGKDDD